MIDIRDHGGMFSGKSKGSAGNDLVSDYVVKNPNIEFVNDQYIDYLRENEINRIDMSVYLKLKDQSKVKTVQSGESDSSNNSNSFMLSESKDIMLMAKHIYSINSIGQTGKLAVTGVDETSRFNYITMSADGTYVIGIDASSNLIFLKKEGNRYIRYNIQGDTFSVSSSSYLEIAVGKIGEITIVNYTTSTSSPYNSTISGVNSVEVDDGDRTITINNALSSTIGSVVGFTHIKEDDKLVFIRQRKKSDLGGSYNFALFIDIYDTRLKRMTYQDREASDDLFAFTSVNVMNNTTGSVGGSTRLNGFVTKNGNVYFSVSYSANGTKGARYIYKWNSASQQFDYVIGSAATNLPTVSGSRISNDYQQVYDEGRELGGNLNPRSRVTLKDSHGYSSDSYNHYKHVDTKGGGIKIFTWGTSNNDRSQQAFESSIEGRLYKLKYFIPHFGQSSVGQLLYLLSDRPGRYTVLFSENSSSGQLKIWEADNVEVAYIPNLEDRMLNVDKNSLFEIDFNGNKISEMRRLL